MPAPARIHQLALVSLPEKEEDELDRKWRVLDFIDAIQTFHNRFSASAKSTSRGATFLYAFGYLDMMQKRVASNINTIHNNA